MTEQRSVRAAAAAALARAVGKSAAATIDRASRSRGCSSKCASHCMPCLGPCGPCLAGASFRIPQQPFPRLWRRSLHLYLIMGQYSIKEYGQED